MGISLTKKVGYISLGKGFISLSSIAIGAILSRFLTKESYGTYRQLWLLYNTLYPIISLGIPTSVNYFIPQSSPEKKKIYNIQTFLLLTTGGIVLLLCFYFGAPFIARMFHNPALVGVAKLFSLIPLLTLPTLYYQNLFICLNKPQLVTKLSFFLAVGRLAGVSLPLLLGGELEGVIIGLIIFSVIQFFMVSYLIFSHLNMNLKGWRVNILYNQLAYAIPIGLAGVVGMLTKQVDKLMISSFFSPSQYATYSNGAFEIPLIGILTGSVTAVLMPEFVSLVKKGEAERLLNIWHRAIRKVGLILIPVMFFLLFYAPEFLVFLFSRKYLESTDIFRLYLLVLPTRITTFGTILLSLGFSKLIYRYSTYTLFFNIILNFLFIKLFGFIGPAIATALSIYLIGFLQLRKIAILLKKDLSSIFPWTILAKIFGVSFLSVIISIWPKLIGIRFSTFYALILGGVTYITALTILSILSKLITKEELKSLLSVGGKKE